MTESEGDGDEGQHVLSADEGSGIVWLEKNWAKYGPQMDLGYKNKSSPPKNSEGPPVEFRNPDVALEPKMIAHTEREPL